MNVRGGIHHETYNKISDTIQQILYGSAYNTLQEARSIVHSVHRDIYREHEGPLQLSVSFDGTWKTRGFHSLFCMGFVIEVLTGFVIDYTIRSKYCVECELVGNKLTGNDKELHADSSGAMETKTAKIMWGRSVDLMNAQYVSVLADGDAAVLSVLNSNANEPLHSVVWKSAPNAVFSSRKTVEIAVAMGIIQFNKGAQVLLDATAAVVPQASPSCQLSELADQMDKTRLPQPN